MSPFQTLLPDAVRDRAEERPDHPAVVAGDTSLSYGRLWDGAARLANALGARGVRRGDRVGVFMDNVPECATALMGVWLADAVVVPVNAQTKAQKLAWILEHCGAVALISEEHLAPAFAPAMEGLDLLAAFSTAEAGAPPEGTEAFDHVIDEADAAAPPNRNTALDLAAILYTSGTTGEPKGVMHSHQSLGFARDSVAAYLELRGDDRVLCALPLSFGYGLYQLLPATVVGATVVLERNFTYPAAVFKRMLETEVTTFAGVPTTFAMILAHDAKKALGFPSVRLVTNAGAALPDEFIPGILRIFSNAGLVKMYGQTECIRACWLPAEMAATHPGSVGYGIPGSELLLLDEQGREVGPDATGTLHVRGPHVMRGYWRSPERTAETLVPGPAPGEHMLRTGDQFRRDGEGLFYFVARQDDIIKSRGEKVSPTEVENAIYALSEVAEALVLGMPDALLGQAVCALVTAKEGRQVDPKDVKRVCMERLEAYMVPTHVLVVDELPRTQRGKLSRKLALEQYEEALGAALPRRPSIPEMHS